MNPLTLAQINAAVDAAFQTALAQNPTIQVAIQQIGDNATLRTDLYTGPKGTGFAVVAVIDLGWRKVTISKQHGPETWREQPLDCKAILDALDANYNAQIARGITVNGITLAAQKDDMDKFTQLISLLREAEELQPDDAAKAAFRSSPTTIADIHDVIHLMTVTEARQLIVQYGQAANTLWTDYANRRAALSV